MAPVSFIRTFDVHKKSTTSVALMVAISRYDGIEGAEVHEGGADGGCRQDEQADANGYVKSL